MKFKSNLVTQVSGSVGGTTFSHNQGGMYMRARSIPTNPSSADQQAVRNNFSSLAARWGTVLTQQNRDDWGNYAFLSPVTDAFGDPLTLSGFQMFLRANTLRLRAGLSPIDVGPAQPGLTDFGTTGLTVVDSPAGISVSFDANDVWVGSAAGALLVQTSRFVSPTINFYKGPFRFLSATPGDGVTPPTSPIDLGDTNAFGQLLDGQYIGMALFVRLIATDAAGRPSPVAIHRAIVAP